MSRLTHTQYNKAVKKDSKARARQSKQPAFCPYHGVPSPKTSLDIKDTITELNEQIVKAKKKTNIKKLTELEKQKHQAQLELAAIHELAHHDLGANVPEELQLAVWARRKEIHAYLSNLEDTLFPTPDEKHIIRKGTAPNHAVTIARQKEYPIASWEITPPYTSNLTQKATPTTIQQQDIVKTFALEHGLDTVEGNYGAVSALIVPISWEEYGMKKTVYEQIVNNTNFKDRLQEYYKAQWAAQTGRKITKFEA